MESGMSIKNVNKVPSKVWKKWTERAQSVFNMVYEFMIENQSCMNHPNADDINCDHWKTISWNAAWVAANACDGIGTNIKKQW